MRVQRIVKALLAAGFLVALAGACWLFVSLRPVAAAGDTQNFEVSPGEGFRDIAASLKQRSLIRSQAAFEVYAFLVGRARNLQPGRYNVSPASSGAAISAILAAGPELEATVTIPEGMTSADIDRLLAQAEIISAGEFFKLATAEHLEGKLFPDTYRFYFHSSPQAVADKLLANFERRAAPLLAADPENAARNLTLASILEKEVPGQEDRQIVAGLLIKRVEAGVPLQVDASLCYAKEQLVSDMPCEPLTNLDKKIESPYNTYLHSGWPPGAIANPGILAIEAALHPKESPYWYYLSDPKSGKTIFARTIKEQVTNQLKYLSNH